MSENERAIASELNETNEICEMSEQLVSMLRDEAEIIFSEADGSIYYTTNLQPSFHKKQLVPDCTANSSNCLKKILGFLENFRESTPQVPENSRDYIGIETG